MRKYLILWMAAGLLSVNIRAQERPASGIPILTYHRFDLKTPASTTVTKAAFESQLGFLAEHGYTIVPLKAAVAILLGEAPVPAHPIAVITIDDGHRSVYEILYPLIRERRIPVTLFIYPSAISNTSYALTWEQLREMQRSGLVDIQSHTYWHPDFRKEKAARSAADYTAFVAAQLTRSRDKLNAELKTHIDLLAWPYGIADSELEVAAKAAGYRAAFAYDGELARPGEDSFSIHRIPVPDSARGAAFMALLRGRQPRSKDKVATHAVWP